jgi:hypothetical protein
MPLDCNYPQLTQSHAAQVCSLSYAQPVEVNLLQEGVAALSVNVLSCNPTECPPRCFAPEACDGYIKPAP